jgi:hypothetical protein
MGIMNANGDEGNQSRFFENPAIHTNGKSMLVVWPSERISIALRTKASAIPNGGFDII